MQGDLQKHARARDGIATRVGMSTMMMSAIIAVLAVVVIVGYAFGPWRAETTSPNSTLGQNTAPVAPSNNSKTTK